MTDGIKTINRTAAADFVMRLLIIGATGGTGLQVTSQAVERGHRVTAFVRSPQKLGSLRQRVVVREGDPRRVAELRDLLPGHDAVISTLGPADAYSMHPPRTAPSMLRLARTQNLIFCTLYGFVKIAVAILSQPIA